MRSIAAAERLATLAAVMVKVLLKPSRLPQDRQSIVLRDEIGDHDHE
jgi:hypothetical protein